MFALLIGFGLGSFVFGAALNAGFAAALGIFSGAQLLSAGAVTRLFSGEISAGVRRQKMSAAVSRY